MKGSSGRWDRSPEVSPVAGGRGGVPGKTLGTEPRRPDLRGHLLLQVQRQADLGPVCHVTTTHLIPPGKWRTQPGGAEWTVMLHPHSYMG